MNGYIRKLIAFTAMLLLSLSFCQAQLIGDPGGDPGEPGGNVQAEIVAQDQTPHVNGTYTYNLYVYGSYSHVDWAVSGGQIVSQSLIQVTVKWTSASGYISAYLTNTDQNYNQYPVGSASLTVSVAPDPMLAFNVPGGVVCRGTNDPLVVTQSELYFNQGPDGIEARGSSHSLTPTGSNSTVYTVTGRVGDYPDLKTIQFEVADRPEIPALGNVTTFGSQHVTLAVTNPKAGYEYVWYQTEAAGTPFLTGTSYSFYASESKTFYVASRLFGTCLSASRTPVTVTVDFGVNVQQMNFIVTTQVYQEGIMQKSELDGLGLNQKGMTYSYLDEFGRPVQTVAKQASPLQTDLVQPVQYDAFGLEKKQFLPYAGGNDGKFKAGAESAVASFYGAGGPGDMAEDSRPFAEVELDNSPLFRPVSQKGLGQNWVGHENSSTVRANTVADAVRRWNTDGTPDTVYQEAILQVSEVQDAQGNKSFVYVNALGQKVLERRQLDDLIGQLVIPYADTYYLYDALGRLTHVVPPQALVEMRKANNYALSLAIKEQWVYSYVYDSRGRLVEKKVPGSAAVYMVYDALDRPVLVQDGNQRASSRWYFTKYDRWSRPVLEGTYTNTNVTTRQGMQQLVNNTVGQFEERMINTTHGYSTINAFPTTTTGVDILSVNYYDSHDLNVDGQPDVAYLPQGLGAKEPVVSQRTKNIFTASKKRVLDGQNNWIRQVMFYDKRGQVVQVRSNHLKNLGNLDETVTTVYAFSGQVEQTLKRHKETATATVLQVNNTFTHDHAGRLTQVNQKHIVGNTAKEQVMASYRYNALGQLVDKKLHQMSQESFLQSVDYRYNIRGQLTHINDSGLAGTDSDAQVDVFGMELLYEKTQAFAGGAQSHARYDGLVSAVKWQVRGTGPTATATNQMERSYKMDYDKLGRMKAAHFSGNKTGNWSTDVGHYNEVLSYDANGNILTLQRKGKQADGSLGSFDELSYSYDGQGNRLKRVTDAGLGDQGFKNGANLSEEYTYDVNGNVNWDANKGVTVSYNIINKVEQVTHTATGHYLKYTYDASGAVLAKTEHNASGQQVVTDYLAGFVYTNNGAGSRLDYFGMAEGRVVNKGTAAYTAVELKYEYFLTDHLGNVRVAFREEQGQVQVVQESHYYPFGLRMVGLQTNTDASGNEHLFNAGSEWEEIFGTYQTFYRHYDPALGRFHSVDPLADHFVAWSPYQYGFNSPFSFNDPTGAITNPGFSTEVWKEIESIWNRTLESTSQIWEKNSDGDWSNQLITMQKSFGGSWGFWYQPASSGSVEGGIVTISAELTRWVEVSKQELEYISRDWGSQTDILDTSGDILNALGNINAIFNEGYRLTIKEVKPNHYLKKDIFDQYSKLVSQAKWVGRAGIVGNIASTGLSLAQMHEKGYTTASVVNFGVDLTITAVGFIPYIGLPASIILGSMNQAGSLDGFKGEVVNYFGK